MSKKFHLTLVRHGETDYNLKRMLQGQVDIPLNETGLMQANTVGKYLAEEKISHWYSSDLKRAIETCKLIKSQNKHGQSNEEASTMQIKSDSRIRERSFGVLEGKLSSELYQAAKKARLGPREYTAEGGESEMQLRKRAEEFYRALFKQIYEECSNHNTDGYCANVLVVAHGGLIDSTCRLFNAKFGCQFKRNPPYFVDNCSTSSFIVNFPPSCNGDCSTQFEERDDSLDDYLTNNWLDGVTIKCTKLDHYQ
ncbi:fructose-2,6-bisphosphatase TIGAR-like [Clavelina lepadiformis]|uniref:fructose-2,6-bisphosphatase TIGAR-like n=1 Tax=Clavelina lepadiformis TaxID=159417 RepID=UPI004042BDC4